MAVETNDIRDIYFSSDEFGTTATVTPSGGSSSTIKVIFDRPDETLGIGEAGLTSHRPRITCKTSDITSLAHGDQVNVNSTNYTIAEILKDGTGIAEIFLEA
jgi:hypothetical protein|tara:strand:+ start:277 stop:582 length:306 start_codon:yes stop_codon:yes gene_type:complete